MLFEWDEAKRAANLKKHGFDLLDAALLFDGRPVITYPSPRDGEGRFVTVGILAETFAAVVWTERNDAIRLISLRKARNEERQAHHSRYG
ncbi:MAG: BrnT family toxin [Beijerinckiaceae bacterium]|nr:BrnT family toxin [Beijerinckiaceae bacterium]